MQFVAGGVKNVGRFANFVKNSVAQDDHVLPELAAGNIFQASFNG